MSKQKLKGKCVVLFGADIITNNYTMEEIDSEKGTLYADNTPYREMIPAIYLHCQFPNDWDRPALDSDHDATVMMIDPSDPKARKILKKITKLIEGLDKKNAEN